MPDAIPSTRRDDAGQVTQAVELIKAYAKQETLGPLRNTGRFLGYGMAGAMLLGLGLVIVAIGILRLLQTETDAFDGTWSFVPYLVVFVFCVLVLALALSRVNAGSLDRRQQP